VRHETCAHCDSFDDWSSVRTFVFILAERERHEHVGRTDQALGKVQREHYPLSRTELGAAPPRSTGTETGQRSTCPVQQQPNEARNRREQVRTAKPCLTFYHRRRSYIFVVDVFGNKPGPSSAGGQWCPPPSFKICTPHFMFGPLVAPYT